MSTGAVASGEVRFAKSGRVLLGAVGAAAPTDVTTALTSAWFEVGYIDQDGVGITPDVSTEPIKKWQSLLPVKYTISDMSLEIKFVMNQWNRANSSLYMYGNQWVNTAAGHSHMVVDSSPEISDLERAMVVEFTDDGGYLTRFYIPRGMVVERDEIKLNRTTDLKLGITYHVMDSSGTMYEIFTNSPTIYSS